MSSSVSMPIRVLMIMLVGVFLMSGCSSPGDAQNPVETNMGGTDGVTENADGDSPEPAQANLEIVQDKTFRISWQPAEGASFYRVLENPDSVSGFNIIGDDIAPSVRTFDHRVALYNRVNAVYIVQACNAIGCTDSVEQNVSGSLEQAIGYFKASNSEGGVREVQDPLVRGGDRFGSAVSISADGKTLAISAPGEDSSATGINGDESDNAAGSSGAVYVFVHEDGKWRQQAYLKASNTESADNFGGYTPNVYTSGSSHAISLSADGNTLAVGALNEKSTAAGIDGDQSDNSAGTSLLTGAGAVYVFERSGEIWQQRSYVKASNTKPLLGTTTNDQFGRFVSLSGDGNTLAVMAGGEDSSGMGINGNQIDDSAEDSGAVYIFVRSGDTWIQQAYVKANNADGIRKLGGAVSLSTDGNTLAVAGADAESPIFRQSGAAYVFERSDGNWRQQAYLKASNSTVDDLFGRYAVSISGDGNTLAIGASGEASSATGVNGNQNDDSAENSGAVYVFVRSNGNWQQQAYLKSNIANQTAHFGIAVGLNADGNTLAVGAYGDASIATGINGDQTNSQHYFLGAAYVFVRSNSDWQQKAYLKSSNRDPEISRQFKYPENFGGAVSLSADGNSLAIGADIESSAATGVNGNQNNTSAPGSGAVYLY